MRERKVREIMTSQVVTARPDMTLRELAQLLLRAGFGGVPVVDRDGRPIGVVSKSDIIDRVHNQSEAYGLEKLFYRTAFDPSRATASLSLDAEDLSDVTVERIMTPLVLSVTVDTPVSLAARMMAFERVHRVIVTDGGRMVGILTTMDIVRAVGEIRPQGQGIASDR